MYTFRDPKLLSKLVNRKRINNQGYTSMIKVNGEEFRGIDKCKLLISGRLKRIKEVEGFLGFYRKNL